MKTAQHVTPTLHSARTCSINLNAPSLTVSLLAASIALALGMRTAASAQEIPKQRAEQIIVTATRSALPLDSVLAQVSVITRDEIDSAGSATIIDLLQRKAGVEIRATGGPGQPAGVFMRGANATHTLVLIDGVRVSSSTSGSTAFENIPLALIERIEVVKGPLSGQYGSDAIGGVVQIFTRQADRSRASVELTAGSFNERGVRADAAFVDGPDAKTRWILQAGTRRVDTPSVSNPLAGSFTYNPDRDAYQNTQGKLGLTHTFSPGNSLSASAWQSKGKAEFDSGAGFARNDQTLTGVNANLSNVIDKNWRSQITLAQTSDDIAIISAFPGNFKTLQTQFAWQHNLRFGTGELSGGIERRDEEVTGSTRYDKGTRKTDSVFATWSQSIDAQRFNLNGRRDREQQFGNRNTGGFSWGVQVSPQHLIYAGVASAFRAPSFNDLYYPGFSNPLLRPEKSHSTELAWRMSGDGSRLNVAAFSNRIEDLIAFDFVSSKPQNIRRAKISGIELSGSTSIGAAQLTASLTSQNPQDSDTGKLLRSRAKLFGALSASRKWNAWELSADIAASGRRYDSADEAPASGMGGYALLNTTLRYRFDRIWNVAVIGQNLTDREVTLARGYNQLGRNVLLRVSADIF